MGAAIHHWRAIIQARWYYDTVLPSDWTVSSIDMDVGNTPVDPAYANITHRPIANKWSIPWAEDDPGLTAPELWVNRSLLHARDSVKYGVGGLLSIHWRTRATSPQIGSAHAVAWNISLTSMDYWVRLNFNVFFRFPASLYARSLSLSLDAMMEDCANCRTEPCGARLRRALSAATDSTLLLTFAITPPPSRGARLLSAGHVVPRTVWGCRRCL